MSIIGPSILAKLPLKIESYPPAVREDVLAAVAGVLAEKPQQLGKPRPRYEPLAEKLSLPKAAPTLIGVSGDPHAGKDIVADYLRARYEDVRSFSFSEAVIAEANIFLAAAATAVPARHAGHVVTQGNKSLPHYRHLLQAWGLARMQEDESYWPKQLRRRIRAAAAAGTRLSVLTGVRSPADVEFVRDLGGANWRVVRPGNTYEAPHAMEQQLTAMPLSNFVVIANDTENNFAGLEKNIERVLARKRQ